MASEKILVSCLILACFVTMATADAPRSEDVSHRIKRNFMWARGFSSDYAKDCRPSDSSSESRTKLTSFTDCFSYGGHKYYLSLFFYTDAMESQRVCNSIGGYIVRINTISELEAIRNYIGNISSLVDHRAILIDGTDSMVEGTWTFFDLMPLPVIDWHPGNPDGGDCLCLADTEGQRMFDVWCSVPYDLRGGRYPYRYMCEIPA